ncbi:hypothetical protein GRF29_69g261364 [Pseudopithomyces chartarum]|uniref:Major facilitator superfamily (MFS) profile domain-containing protein n=1 Tax=Pseudopithomyces chartarum TaxID=1892770 RepID=A0AAN6RIZ7_9PLEO|nr:hypothetical protein GRF29_69g261364 [Pseudopithomyces chartarum]
MSSPEITTAHNKTTIDEKDANRTKAIDIGDVGSIEKGDAPTFYSKVSVYLMMLFSGLALGSDGYNAAVMSNLNLLLTVIYPETLSSSMKARLSNAFLIGMIVGMVGFGVVVDQLGRKTGAVLTTLILLLGIILSAGASGTSPLGLFWMLVVARGIAGVGAGGEYPVAGAGALEASDEAGHFRKRRGFLFAMVADLAAGLGYCFGALVPLLLLLCVKQRVDKYHIVWRTALALGAVPPLSIFYFRMRMKVSTAYRKSALRKQRTPYVLIAKKYYRRLFGAALGWFLYNWISIPFGIFGSTIVARMNPNNSLIQNLGWGVVINAFYLPGPFIGAILGFILGGAGTQIQNVFPLFIVLYGIFLTLGEVGPGSTVVITATEPFPTSVRGHTMGFISACSKAGAAIGTEVFTAIMASYTDANKSNQVAFLVGSAFAVLGALNAWFVIQDGSKVLDNEDEIWKDYLTAHGWDADWGDHETQDPVKSRNQELLPTS